MSGDKGEREDLRCALKLKERCKESIESGSGYYFRDIRGEILGANHTAENGGRSSGKE